MLLGNNPTHLGRNHGADFGEDHMTREGEQDVVAEGGEPHRPLEVSYVLFEDRK